MSTPGVSRDKSSDSLISLYSRIPDYSEVKHLGHSEFIYTLEKLKEEFRQCRSTLYNEDSIGSGGGSSSSDIDYITERTSKVLNIDSPSAGGRIGNQYEGKFMKIANANLSTFVKGCELHSRVSAEANSLNYNLHFNKPSRSLSFNLGSKSDQVEGQQGQEDENEDDISSGMATPNSDISKWSSSPDLYSRPYVPPTNIEKR